MNFKFFKLIPCALLALVYFTSCDKEDPLMPSLGPSVFMLEAMDGNCSSYSVGVDYVQGKPLGDTHTIRVNVEVTQPGSYSISTNETNGYKFTGSGTFQQTGQQAVTLQGSGTPQNFQTDVFTISAASGNTSCALSITVKPDAEEMANRIIICPASPHFTFDYDVQALNGKGELLWVKPGYGFTAAIENDIAYMVMEGNLQAVDVRTGETFWATNLENRPLHQAATLSEGVLYMSGTRGNIFAINATDGSLRWTFETGEISVLNSIPAVGSGSIYFGAPDGYVYALWPDGSVRWKTLLTEASSIYSSPSVTNGHVYIGATDGSLYALNAETGSIAWQFAAGLEEYASPTISNGKVYIVGEYQLYCLDAANGAKVWHYDIINEGGSQAAVPIEQNGILYVNGLHTGIHAFDANTGESLWTNESYGKLSNGSVVLFKDVAYLSRDSGLTAYSTLNGETLWNYGNAENYGRAPVVAFIKSPVVYDLSTKEVSYPADSGNKQ